MHLEDMLGILGLKSHLISGYLVTNPDISSISMFGSFKLIMSASVIIKAVGFTSPMVPAISFKCKNSIT